jgi:protein TonB
LLIEVIGRSGRGLCATARKRRFRSEEALDGPRGGINLRPALLKTTFTNDNARFLTRPSPEVAEGAARAARGAWFVGVSVVAHAAVLLLWRGAGDAPTLQPARESLIEFAVELPPPPVVAPPPAAMPPPPPPPADIAPVVRVARSVAPARAAAEPEPTRAEPAPASLVEAPAAAAAPGADAAATPGALPTDAGGALAMRTGAGGVGALGGGGPGGFGPPAEQGGAAPLVDRRALALAWKARIERLVHEQASHHYPRSAARAGLGGTVLLAITIDGSGHITQVSVDRTSGYEVLDRAALEAVQDLADVPAPPEALAWQTRALRMPIAYAIH